MKLVLLSGGSGKRLWPLSNDARSKQFLKVLQGENGQQESMVQRVWRQLKNEGLADSALIATGKSQVDMIQSQLGTNVPVIIEPERRDTFPAIALAASYIYSVEQASLDEVIVVLPVDPFVEDEFFAAIKRLAETLSSTNADLALLGVTPTYPSVKYGYIVPCAAETDKPVIKVSHFREKPSEVQAEELIKQQALWNCGVFAFKLKHIISLLQEKGLPVKHAELLAQYNSLPKISFDYEVVEKAQNIVAVKYNGYWKDLGTWNTLTEEMHSPIIGKGIVCKDSINTHLINELDIPITVLGLSDIVVAASPDGILVTDKDSSPKVKELVANLEQRPMYEERRWGWYRVLDHAKFANGNEVLTKRIGVHAGKNLSYQVHSQRMEVWTIIKGEGEFALDGVIYPVKTGDVLSIPNGAKHGVKAITELEIIEVQTGKQLIEEDITRIYMTWTEVQAHCKEAKLPLEEIAAAKA
jgi:mannose-1-phosphate guanylyltransferase